MSTNYNDSKLQQREARLTLSAILKGYLLHSQRSSLGHEQRANDTILMVQAVYIPLAHLKFHLKRGVRLDMH